MALAAAAATAGVFAAWDLVSGADAISPRLRALSAPLRRAGAEGRPPTPAERQRLGLLCAASLLAGGWLAAGPLPGAVLAASAPAAVVSVLRARQARYAAAVRTGAAPAARAMAGALAAGRSVRAALAEAGDVVEGPAGRELRRAARSLALGEPTEETLRHLRVRARGGPWDTLVAALSLHRDAGGDLAGLLRDLAGSLEAASRAERDAHAATAQARLTARIVAALPVLAAVLAEIGSPGFLAGLVSEPLPLALTLAAAGLQAAGFLAIRRIVP